MAARLNDLDGEVAAAARALAAAEQQRVHAGRDYNDGLDQLEEAITAWATSKSCHLRQQHGKMLCR